ncbi:MAG TPA: ABC transporter ATP-binding protein/permease [Candidatus Cybelea sp.]|nr:ABC transporter ATP-binding protein/permease [Candidatus Cybelea sp.]
MAAGAAGLTAPGGLPGAPRHPPGFFRQFVRLAGPYWQSEEKWQVRALTMALIALTLGQVALMIWTNYWNASLFDALEQKSVARFLVQIGVFVVILASTMAVTAVHLAVKRRIQLNWRRWLTRRLVELWMAEGRHYQLSYLPGDHDNPDGRIAEDIRNTTEVAMELAHSFFYSGLILVSFVEILWSISGTLSFSIGDIGITIPGHMVWLAFLYASVGSTLAFFLGKPYVKATDARQTVEANLRFGLARARENSEAIALIHGESGEQTRIRSFFGDIERAWHLQTVRLAWILLFTSGYGVLATAFPLLVTAPRYIASTITLGILMQTAQAFQQVTSALSWPVDNLAKRAEWRASAERVLVLYSALQDLSEEPARIDGRAIEVTTGDKPELMLRDLSITTPDGEAILAGFNAKIGLGEHVLISGDPDAALMLFKVVAGLWPWGRGRVELPNNATIFFMPQRPYLPIGSLRSVVSYPAAPDAFGTAVIEAALARSGLNHWVAHLDESNRWEQTLTAGERQRLGFARLLLHRPNWIFLQNATDALDPTDEDDMMRLLQNEFRDSTVLTLGDRANLEAYHGRQLTLARPEGKPTAAREASVPQAESTRRARERSRAFRLLQALKGKPDRNE